MKAIKNHSIAILGSGISGMGALRLAAKHGMKAFLSEHKSLTAEQQEEIQKLGFRYEKGGHRVEHLLPFDVMVKSPGIPDTAPIIRELKKAGKAILSEVEFASRFTDAKIIGITGSNGKTTTTLLTAHLLQSAGLNAVAAGNVGHSFSDLLVAHDPDIVVLELSSFQLEGIQQLKPHIGILMNITPDHLDRYAHDMEQYAKAKFRLIKNMDEQDVLILNEDDEVMARHPAPAHMKGLRLGISTTHEVKQGAHVQGGDLVFHYEGTTQKLPMDALPLIGRHNLYNQMAAILTALHCQGSWAEIGRGLKSFKNAPHRMERVAEINGVSFINDSKATNVDAVYYALEAMNRPVVWLAGGVDKGNDYGKIKVLVQTQVKALVLLGKDKLPLMNAFDSHLPIIASVMDMETAVEMAYEFAQAGDVVLLSPACASFDWYESYEQRGEDFKTEVLRLKKEKEGISDAAV